MADARQRLVGLLDYVEQVIRLDERVAFRLSEYRLPDGSTFAISADNTRDLPGVRHDLQDDEGASWLEVDRLVRKDPPPRPDSIRPWIAVSSDPTQAPEIHQTRIVTVSAPERDEAIAKGEVRPDDIMVAPKKRGESSDAPTRYDLTLRLEDRPLVRNEIEGWIGGAWSEWSKLENPRRRTIALYQSLYKVFQLVEVGGAESPVEVIWGIGAVNWQKDGRIVDRPLLERRVDIELDEKRGGVIRIRPTAADASFDLKPYEELGCSNLPSLAELMKREIQTAAENDGILPFVKDSFEFILMMASSRIDAEGNYKPQMDGAAQEARSAKLIITDKWVLFARPRSQHIILQDIDRMRRSTEDLTHPLKGFSERLVTAPSNQAAGSNWTPLSSRIGASAPSAPASEAVRDETFDVFFPKPFNDDQLEIVRRLNKSDGLVVQGPPGTGKTHTIANLICHAMATGQRVLVVSRGEAALTVLKEQLPKEVQPLAIAVLSNEREGLRQIESTIRNIQSVIEETQPGKRRDLILRLETDLDRNRKRIDQIDRELDGIAEQHFTKVGPRDETPAELAQRIVTEREAYRWFGDRPARFVSETGLTDAVVGDLFQARIHCGDLIDHLDARLPSPLDLPDAATLLQWHHDLIGAREQKQAADTGPSRTMHLTRDRLPQSMQLAKILEELALAHEACSRATWLEPFRQAALQGQQDPWSERLREMIATSAKLDAERVHLSRRSVVLPEVLLDNLDAREAIRRGAKGERLWSLVAFGKSPAKALVAAVRLDGAPVRDDDADGWRYVEVALGAADQQREFQARWDGFAEQIGAPAGKDTRPALNLASRILHCGDNARIAARYLSGLTSNEFTVDRVATDPQLCRALAGQIRALASSVQLATVEQARQQLLQRFDTDDRTSVIVRQLLQDVVGKPSAPMDKIGGTWEALLKRLERLKSLQSDFQTIRRVTDQIAAAGAPQWATTLRSEKPVADDPRTSPAWRDAWDHAAADAHLHRIDARQKLMQLSEQRDICERRCRELFGQIVRERTFYQLEQRLSAAIKAALVTFVRALTRIGKGTGKSAGTHRHTARQEMAKCYGAVPCWIMPTWRVAEQLPAELGAVELVIIDEASQSDVTELPALMRGKKILVVGDDRQVSPTAPFVTQEKIVQLKHHFLGDSPYGSLMEPGESIYDLMRAVFPDQRLMLKEHFRCVEPIIRFSMQFYPEKMLPLRIPAAHERLDPPLIDIYVPHGSRERRKKVNIPEADVIVDEIALLTGKPDMKDRTIGVISLVGSDQSEFIRSRLSERIGEEIMQRHAILCGDSATFQGSERDIVFLSMVADPRNKTALTMQRYEQRFNVAISRARDRVVLVRSVRREELKEDDLKARLIAHFENPMPGEEAAGDALATCESQFERDVMQHLISRGYRVQGQVGSLGYRIDMVVEGADHRRLAIECDGDAYHGPQQWRNDMRRQRVLERVGWRFWRCFASSFYRDQNGVMNDLFEQLARLGIEPVGNDAATHHGRKLTEYRVITPPQEEPLIPVALEDISRDLRGLAEDDASFTDGISVGDRVVLIYADTKARISVRLTNDSTDIEKGRLSVTSPLGQAICGAEEGTEVEFGDSGRTRTILIESVQKDIGEMTGRRADSSPAAAVNAG
ncbi:AAA domain-containing protein [Bradyrhizobium sp. HKCCYLRH3083]|uniref:AAA domain-containing protein n=1 Tax=unclassified Bradyrhizobium TaxID=2631580 RepID=UPI003EBA963C